MKQNDRKANVSKMNEYEKNGLNEGEKQIAGTNFATKDDDLKAIDEWMKK